MSTYKVPPALRLALWSANDFKCWFCSESIELRSLNIDHLIPENTPAARLLELATALGLDASFQVNDPLNLVPSHFGCNARKKDTEFTEASLRYYLELSRVKQPAVERERKRLDQQRSNNRLLSTLGARLAGGAISASDVLFLLHSAKGATTPSASEPLVVAFGIETDSHPDITNVAYPNLCDRIEAELLERLANALHAPMAMTESDRNGETAGMRVAFWNLDVSVLERVDLGGWKVLEIEFFSDVYPGDDWSDCYARATVKEYHAMLKREPDRCPGCGGKTVKISRVTDYANDENYIIYNCTECEWSDWSQ